MSLSLTFSLQSGLEIVPGDPWALLGVGGARSLAYNPIMAGEIHCTYSLKAGVVLPSGLESRDS